MPATTRPVHDERLWELREWIYRAVICICFGLLIYLSKNAWEESSEIQAKNSTSIAELTSKLATLQSQSDLKIDLLQRLVAINTERINGNSALIERIRDNGK